MENRISSRNDGYVQWPISDKLAASKLKKGPVAAVSAKQDSSHAQEYRGSFAGVNIPVQVPIKGISDRAIAGQNLKVAKATRKVLVERRSQIKAVLTTHKAPIYMRMRQRVK